MRQKRRSSRDYDDEDPLNEDLAAVNDRLDDLARQLQRMARTDVMRREVEDDRSADRVSAAIARLDRRLDQIINEGRAAASEMQRRAASLPPPPPPPPAPVNGPPNWASEISARQRALDGDARPAARPAGPDLSGLEQHLRQITSQIAGLHRPYEDALTALRGDLAEIGRALTEALPRRAVEALETEVRTLADRVGRSRHGGADASTLTGLEQGLAEVRDALHGLRPAESLVGVDEAVRGLSRKIDQIASTNVDPNLYQQIEHAITSLRSAVSNVASDGALAQLAAEVHGLASKFEQAAKNSGAEALAKLDARIATLMDSGRGVPPELESSIRILNERLDRMSLSQGDQFALGSLEDRIVKLYEKLDTSEARLGSLGAIERGIADLLVQVEELRTGNSSPRGPRTAAAEAKAPSAPPPKAEVPKAQPAPAMPAAPQLQVPTVEALPPPAAAPAAPPVVAAPPLAPNAPAVAAKPTRARDQRPIDANLPPDTPLEPGSGAPLVKPGSPAARIAASEAALGGMRSAAAEPGGNAAAVAAARNAAKSAIAEAPPAPAPKAKPKPVEPVASPEAAAEIAPVEGRVSLRTWMLKKGKTLLVAVSVIIIVLGMLQAAIDFFLPSTGSDAPASAPAEKTAPATPPVPGRSMPTPEGSLPAPAEADPTTTDSIGRRSSLFDPTTVLAPKAPRPDVTGSVNRPPRSAILAAPTPPATAVSQASTGGLPSSIGPALRAAAAANDPAAEYEIGLRYADGRGVPQNVAEAVIWFERAAKSGFAPAQFRLASLYEKGDGLKKDLQVARRLYVAAADKGHAKAMHNLAVLYAEGVEGKPDYKVAAQWFRRAAVYGVADSQYNLAILYARGIGVEQNLAESYKWFALAAARGDADATRKRDDVGARLDQSSLMAARLAAQTFTPEREPDEATSLKAPAGGWDRTPAAAVQPVRPKPPAAGSPPP